MPIRIELALSYLELTIAQAVVLEIGYGSRMKSRLGNVLIKIEMAVKSEAKERPALLIISYKSYNYLKTGQPSEKA